MCKKTLLFVFCLIGLQFTTIKSLPWGLKARKAEAIKYYGVDLKLDRAIKNNKIGLLRYYASLNYPHGTKGLESIETSIASLRKSTADMTVRMQRCKHLRNDFINDINKAQSVSEIRAIQSKYRDRASIPDEYYKKEFKKTKITLNPNSLLHEFGLSNIESVRGYNTMYSINPAVTGESAKGFEDEELDKMFRQKNPEPISELTRWQKIKNFLSSGSNKPSSVLGFTQVPLQTLESHHYYNFAMPEGMQQRFQGLKQRAQAFPTKQLTPQQVESRLYEHYTMPSPESRFVTPH
jgi:hypothetical protein